uniref:Metallo-beta-lactamase domain-containing protein n=1 Tax=Aegilops tauschii subsp. strangulata TaxID=200361 RepID=A0A453KPN9_AEGTS
LFLTVRQGTSGPLASVAPSRNAVRQATSGQRPRRPRRYRLAGRRRKADRRIRAFPMSGATAAGAIAALLRAHRLPMLHSPFACSLAAARSLGAHLPPRAPAAAAPLSSRLSLARLRSGASPRFFSSSCGAPGSAVSSSAAEHEEPRKSELIFLGTGTSEGVPRVSCLTDPSKTCPVCIKAVEPGNRNRRRNTSILLRHVTPSRTSNILIDAGKFFYHSALEWFPAFGY